MNHYEEGINAMWEEVEAKSLNQFINIRKRTMERICGEIQS